MPRFACPSVVGRDAEWKQLHGALDDLAHHGRGQLICLQGEPGIGKTRLSEELAAAGRARQLRVLSGRAVETDTPIPYRALFEALAGHFRDGEQVDVVASEAFRPALAQLIPQWRHPGDELYRASPVELAEALLRLLTMIGRPEGSVLVLEDLHWADADTAAVVEYIGDNVGSLPILCVITSRPDAACPVHRAVRALESRRSAHVIELRQRLDSGSVIEIAQLCLGTTSLPSDVTDMVLRFSDGLPFLVEELLASAVGAGFVRFESDGWRTGPAESFVVPERFTDLVRRRLAALPARSAEALTVAAVAAPRFTAEVLAVLTRLPIQSALVAIQQGEAAQLVAADPSDPTAFGFRHALTRAGIVSQLLPAVRLAIARRALADLEADDPGLPGERCDMAATLAAIAGDKPRAAELLLLAARRAMAIGAFASAEPTLAQAMEYAGDGTAARFESGCLLVEVLTHVGEVDRALEFGRQLHDHDARMAARAGIPLAVARAAVVAHRWEVASRALDDARADVSADDDAARLAEIQAIEAVMAFEASRVSDAEASARSALAAAERDGSGGATACAALHVLGMCSRSRGDVVGAERWFDQLVEIAARDGLWTWRLRGSMERASLDAWRALPSDRIIAARDQAVDAGALVVAAHLDNFLAWMAHDRWETAVADAAAERCAASARRLKLGSLAAMALTVRAIAAAQRGEREQIETRLAEAAAVDPGNLDPRALSSAAWVDFWLRRDDLSRAADELQVMMDLLRESPSPAPEPRSPHARPNARRR